jgi:beta-mannanase
VISDPGSGYTASDYAAMFHHVVERLRQHGVTNLVTVFNVMGFSGHGVQPWFGDLYPGDDVVDWVAGDLYACREGNRPCGDFAGLVNQSYDAGWPGFYAWATTTHPDKPVMLAEWGVYGADGMNAKARFVRGIAKQLPDFPAVKALVYFDAPQNDGRGTDVDSSAASASAFRALFADKYFRQRVR